MLQHVDVSPRSLTAYTRIAPAALHQEIHALALFLRGLRVVHINATPDGGGVAEILRSMALLLRFGGRGRLPPSVDRGLRRHAWPNSCATRAWQRK